MGLSDEFHPRSFAFKKLLNIMIERAMFAEVKANIELEVWLEFMNSETLSEGHHAKELIYLYQQDLFLKWEADLTHRKLQHMLHHFKKLQRNPTEAIQSIKQILKHYLKDIEHIVQQLRQEVKIYQRDEFAAVKSWNKNVEVCVNALIFFDEKNQKQILSETARTNIIQTLTTNSVCDVMKKIAASHGVSHHTSPEAKFAVAPATVINFAATAKALQAILLLHKQVAQPTDEEDVDPKKLLALIKANNMALKKMVPNEEQKKQLENVYVNGNHMELQQRNLERAESLRRLILTKEDKGLGLFDQARKATEVAFEKEVKLKKPK